VSPRRCLTCSADLAYKPSLSWTASRDMVSFLSCCGSRSSSPPPHLPPKHFAPSPTPYHIGSSPSPVHAPSTTSSPYGQNSTHRNSSWQSPVSLSPPPIQTNPSPSPPLRPIPQHPPNGFYSGPVSPSPHAAQFGYEDPTHFARPSTAVSASHSFGPSQFGSSFGSPSAPAGYPTLEPYEEPKEQEPEGKLCIGIDFGSVGWN
jgi:hypothetical protein